MWPPGANGSPRYGGFHETSFVLTKDPRKADLAVRYEKDANAGVTVVKELQKVQDKHPFTTKLGIEEVRRRLHKKGVRMHHKGEAKEEFNNFHWNTFVKFYGMKGDPRYAHNWALTSENPSYVYSQQAVEFIVEQVVRDPEHVIDQLIEKMSEKK